mmetsp:Transcript_25322/g.68554  ORF Transcript_25322/g.68554 Transcript_25322/m.68554 type:complete len:222 (-) Transcript_25322:325-990(-)
MMPHRPRAAARSCKIGGDRVCSRGRATHRRHPVWDPTLLLLLLLLHVGLVLRIPRRILALVLFTRSRIHRASLPCCCWGAAYRFRVVGGSRRGCARGLCLRLRGCSLLRLPRCLLLLFLLPLQLLVSELENLLPQVHENLWRVCHDRMSFRHLAHPVGGQLGAHVHLRGGAHRLVLIHLVGVVLGHVAVHARLPVRPAACALASVEELDAHGPRVLGADDG